jgi:hypothetical protein
LTVDTDGLNVGGTVITEPRAVVVIVVEPEPRAVVLTVVEPEPAADPVTLAA